MNDHPRPATVARHTILLVDDDARVRHNMALLLRWAGDWEVVGEAADGDTALALAAACRPELVLLDRWLADGDSLRLLPRLRALDSSLRIAILTADPTAAAELRTLAPRAAICLDKMIPPLELLATLRALVLT
ncbi:MAG TPA: response regulator [Roseiflexaceae bacterium]|nr:response regulator [Roseiflexaceae bacterium]